MRKTLVLIKKHATAIMVISSVLCMIRFISEIKQTGHSLVWRMESAITRVDGSYLILNETKSNMEEKLKLFSEILQEQDKKIMQKEANN